MGAIEELSQWVEKKPIVIKAFNEEDSTRFIYAKGGRLDFITFTRPHNEVNVLKLPTVCLFELTIQNIIHCFIGVVKRNDSVSTLDSRVTVVKLQEISISSFDSICERIFDTGHRNRFKNHLLEKDKIEVLTPRLSSHLISIIADDPSNQNAIETIFANIPGLYPKTDLEISQENALKIAMKVFGIDIKAVPQELHINTNSSTALSQLDQIYLREDNVIFSDATHIEGLELFQNMDVTGRAVFLKKDERLEVYTANRNPLEKALGVDLIYYNQTLGSIVMVQYKMLEKIGDDENNNWNFRLDHQTIEEISRMKIPEIQSEYDDYRLNKSPFYFKFVERIGTKSSIKSYVISLEHLKNILMSPLAKGPRGGIRIDYSALECQRRFNFPQVCRNIFPQFYFNFSMSSPLTGGTLPVF